MKNLVIVSTPDGPRDWPHMAAVTYGVDKGQDNGDWSVINVENEQICADCKIENPRATVCIHRAPNAVEHFFDELKKLLNRFDASIDRAEIVVRDEVFTCLSGDHDQLDVYQRRMFGTF